MTTTGLASWETDLAQVAAIYPFQGLEFLFILIVTLLLIVGLIVAVLRERTQHARTIAAHGTYEVVMAVLDQLAPPADPPVPTEADPPPASR